MHVIFELGLAVGYFDFAQKPTSSFPREFGF
jgi:hypothetical protein